jgi:iron-sulfur cluster repair protein YtfE (RIC family)
MEKEKIMTRITEPLREEHRELLPHIEALRTAADSIGDVSSDALRDEVDGAYEFLVEHLIPHATAEDRALYPVVARVMGAPEATATMVRDHVTVGQLTKELGGLRSELHGEPAVGQLKALRRILYGLYALVSTHFAKEEEVYLPLLEERLSAEQAEAMFQQLEVAAAEARPTAIA